MRRFLNCLALLTATLAAGPLSAAEIDYEESIKPLLMEKCSACHGVLRQEAGLRLDASQLIRKGSGSGPVVNAGDAATSVLLERVQSDDPADRMPPEGEGEALDEAQIALLRAWIDAGAPAPEEEPVVGDPKEHWAYQPISRPAVSHVDSEAAVNHPIDAFLVPVQNSAGVIPLPRADRDTLLRRLTFDLVGLPPTPEERNEFAADTRHDAYEQVVERLLMSPRHGERWARHWMDIWRYSDWDGYKNELRGSQRHIWRWRDWIVESLNADVGYDQMVHQMLAGDELAPEDPDVLRATGFLARNYHKSNRNIWLDATVEHTAKAFLGMTIDCARCHDHKFDPIPQTEYYAFRAIFEPHEVRVDRLPGQPDTMQDGLARAFDAQLDAQTYLYLAGNEKHPDKENPLEPAVPAVIGSLADVAEVELPLSSSYPTLREFVRREEFASAEEKLDQARKALQTVLAAEPQQTRQSSSETRRPPAPSMPRSLPLQEQLVRARLRSAEANFESLRARWAADEARFLGHAAEDLEELARTAARLERTAALRQAQSDLIASHQALVDAEDQKDDAKRQKALDKATKDQEAARAALDKAEAAFAEDPARYTAVGEVYPRTSTGRRTALARWITAPGNPLTARVAVNHLWLRHFGDPLVENVFDFGLRSPRPVHADLLDWLAVELMENNWSMKHLHRLIVTSAAYQRASSAETALTAANEAIDPDNRLLWRANIRRLDAEVIRDSVLAVAGSLDTTTGGPEIDFQKGESVLRRSLYFRHAYEKQMTMLVLFDAANPTDCYRRSESIVPQQALSLANSSLTLSESRKLARRLHGEETQQQVPIEQFIDRAFVHVLSRQPTDDERVACREFLASQGALLEKSSELTAFDAKDDAAVAPADDAQMRARENLVHVLMNHNDFVTLR